MTEQPEFGALSPDDLETLVRKIKKARDSYAKMDEMDNYVDWGQRKPLLWHLTRTGILDTWNEPELWTELVEGIEHASAEDVAAFLSKVETYDRVPEPGETSDEGASDAYDEDEYYDDEYYEDDYYDGYYEDDSAPSFESQRLVAFWPAALDDLAMLAYADDPSPFDEHWESFAEPVQQGLKLVRHRFGDLGAGELPEGIIEALATEHVDNNGLPWSVFVPGDDGLVRVEIGSQQTPKEEFDAFIERFGSLEDWKQAVLEHALAIDYIPGFDRVIDAFAVANLDQLTELLAGISLYESATRQLYDILLDQRDDSPEELVQVARALHDEHNEKSTAEICAAVAILKCKRADKPVAEGVETLLTLSSPGVAITRDAYSMLGPVVEALRYLPEERAVDHLIELLEGEYTSSYAYAGLQAWPRDERLLDTAFAQAIRPTQSDYANFASMNPIANGLALIGPSVLPRLARAHDEASNDLLREGYRRAIIYILADLADAGEPLPDGYDRFVDYVAWRKEQLDGHNFGHYVVGDLNKVVAAVDDARAEALVLPQLDTKQPRWARALEAVKLHPIEALLERAFALIAEHGVPAAEDGFNWFENMLREVGEPAGALVGQALASSDSAELHNSVRRVLGEPAYEQMLAAAGAESAADKTHADKIARLSKAYFNAHSDAKRTTIYVLERLDDAGADTDLNRIGGRPFGVDADTWPCKDDDADQPMEHMFTLDMNSVPQLQSRVGDDVRAVALYVYQPDYNEAWTPYNSDTTVMMLTEDDLSDGPFDGELPTGDDSPRAFSVQAVEVPVEAFVEMGWDEERDADLEAIRNAVYRCRAYVGGEAIWLQSDESAGFNFLMQFDEGFVHMNLGDCGVMYVYPDTAFWQCY